MAVSAQDNNQGWGYAGCLRVRNREARRSASRDGVEGANNIERQCTWTHVTPMPSTAVEQTHIHLSWVSTRRHRFFLAADLIAFEWRAKPSPKSVQALPPLTCSNVRISHHGPSEGATLLVKTTIFFTSAGHRLYGTWNLNMRPPKRTRQ